MTPIRCLVVGLLALFLAGCASLPENLPRGAPGYAPAPQPGGPLAIVEAALKERIGPDQSGFVLLQSNEDGLRWRLALIEMRSDAAVQPLFADTAPPQTKFMGLHIKAMVIDRERVFIGSMTLDPRSVQINSAMGVIVESPGLARELAVAMERDMNKDNGSRVTLDANGQVRWTAGDDVRSMQPARNFRQRVEDVLFMASPRDLY